MVSYSFINFGGGFGISACCHANKLACLAGMIYCGYGIIMDFSALSHNVVVVFIKNNMVLHRLCDLCVLTLVMGSTTCYKIEYYS